MSINLGCAVSDYTISMKFTKKEKTVEQETVQNEKEDERNVQVEKEEPTKMQIKIEANDGKKYNLTVDKGYTIEQVKTAIPDSSALLNDQQSLSFNGKSPLNCFLGLQQLQYKVRQQYSHRFLVILCLYENNAKKNITKLKL